MHDNYNFDSFNKSKKEPTKKRSSLKIRLTNSQLIVTLMSIIILVLGIRWRLSIGGKLIIITGIGWLLTAVLELLNYQIKRVHKFFAVCSIVFSILIGISGYLKNSYKDLKFTQNTVNRAVNDTGNLYIGNQDLIDMSKVKIKSSNEKVAKFNPITNEFLCLSEGVATLSVLDLYGHRGDANVTCYKDVGFVKTTFRSYVIQGDLAYLRIGSNRNYDQSLLEYYEDGDNLYIQGTDIIGAKLGTSWVRHNHEDQGPVSSEISVLKRGAFVLDVTFTDLYYGQGDQIPLEKLLDVKAKGKEITIANLSEGLIVEDGIVSFHDVGIQQGDFTYDGITESLKITVGSKSLQAVYLPQVDYETLRINQITPLEMIALPTYSNIEGIRLISMDDSIVRVEGGKLVPVSKGETEIIISQFDFKKSFKVIYE